jgi:hypothetical protein
MEMDITLYEKCARENAEKIRKQVSYLSCLLPISNSPFLHFTIELIVHLPNHLMHRQEVEREAAAMKWKLIADNAAACGIDVEALLI